ncbi:MAG: T9SS type A sorting domain-containing protein [Ignavibacteriales bacterium]|nr:T9SS type A sorting domain-containing protein [Ignavibacteriales bacterium]
MRKADFLKTLSVTTLLALASSLSFGENTLSVVRTSLNTIEINFDNFDDVAGIQFSIRSSANITISDFQRSEEKVHSDWIVASYQPNDTIINVVILGSSRLYFTKGQRPVARIAYRVNDQSSPTNAVYLTNVMLASPKADSLQVTVQNAEWTTGRQFAAAAASANVKLGQNFPNPFNPSTRVTYSLLKAGQVRLSVYDVTGREVARLVDGYQFVGDYNVTWNSKDAVGGVLPSGVYFARIQADNEVATAKMILAK